MPSDMRAMTTTSIQAATKLLQAIANSQNVHKKPVIKLTPQETSRMKTKLPGLTTSLHSPLFRLCRNSYARTLPMSEKARNKRATIGTQSCSTGNRKARKTQIEKELEG
jgi:hypothetical protein